MSERPYMKLWIADYLGDTQHLTTEESGAYLHLLMAMWTAGGYLENEPTKLARIARLTPWKWAKVAPSLAPFFLSDGERITQKRLLHELRNSQEISKKRAEARAARSLKDKEAVPANASTKVGANGSQLKPYARAYQSHSHSHSHSSEDGLQEDGEDVWAEHPERSVSDLGDQFSRALTPENISGSRGAKNRGTR